MKWVMSKMKPKKYGDKLDMTTDGKAITVELISYSKTLAQSEETRTPAVVVEAKTEEGIFMSAINYIFSLPSLLSKTALSFVSWTVSVLFDLLNFILPHWSYKQKD